MSEATQRYHRASKSLALLSLVLVVLTIPVVLNLLGQSQDIRQQAKTDKTTCKQECPSTKDGVLRNCTPPDTDGNSQDSLCNLAGRVEACGGKSYCCPSVGGKWTTNMTKCTPSPTPTLTPAVTVTPGPSLTPSPSPTPLPTGSYLKEDINQDGKVDQKDLDILLANYNVSPLSNSRADLTGDGKVNALDYAHLIDAFGQRSPT